VELEDLVKVAASNTYERERAGGKFSGVEVFKYMEVRGFIDGSLLLLMVHKSQPVCGYRNDSHLCRVEKRKLTELGNVLLVKISSIVFIDSSKKWQF
jgi:hypothetical protein